MKLTKYEHSFVIIENEDGDRIIIDPGAFSTMPEDLNNVSAVVVTHEHGDHFSIDNISKIKLANPDLLVYAPSEVADKMGNVIVPDKDREYKAGSFNLTFYGDKHEFIREDLPIINNLGVCINNYIAYPGDSYALLEKQVDYILTPASGPWLRIKEATEFLSQSNAKNFIPTHDAMLSDIGRNTYDNHFTAVADKSNKIYRRLQIGETIELT